MVYNAIDVSNQEQTPLVIYTIGISITNMLVAYVSIEAMVEHSVMRTLTTSLQRPYISTSQKQTPLVIYTICKCADDMVRR